MGYMGKVKTEHGEYGSFVDASRRLAELHIVDLVKELRQAGHRHIIKTWTEKVIL